jgi:hypothetical protein
MVIKSEEYFCLSRKMRRSGSVVTQEHKVTTKKLAGKADRIMIGGTVERPTRKTSTNHDNRRWHARTK